METQQVELKLQVDSKKNRVLFAECGSDFVDLLFFFLTLPMGKIIRLIGRWPEIGSMTSLYESLDNLHRESFQSDGYKAMLLGAYQKPEEETTTGTVGGASDVSCFKCSVCARCFSSLAYAPCFCGHVMSCPVTIEKSWLRKESKNNEGMFVSKGLSFMVTDDLRVMPLSIASTFSLMNEMGVEDYDSFRDVTVTVRVQEVLNLLKHSLLSKQPLTDVFLRHESADDPIQCPSLKERARPLEETQSASYLKMDVNAELKLFLSKTSHSILYAEAQENFVNLLLSFLIFPLGCVIKLLDEQSTVGSIDKLTNSIKILSQEKYMKPGVKEHNVVLPMHIMDFDPQSLSLPIAEELQIPSLFDHPNYYRRLLSTPVDVMANKQYMKGPAKFMIKDGLEIVPASAISGLSTLRELGVALNDVEEIAVNIGEEEALTLLKACLTSKSVLNDFYRVMSGA